MTIKRAIKLKWLYFKISDVFNYWQAKLAGNRNTHGSFYNRGGLAYLWSSTELGSHAYRRNLNTSHATVNRKTNNKANGLSIRCLGFIFLMLLGDLCINQPKPTNLVK